MGMQNMMIVSDMNVPWRSFCEVQLNMQILCDANMKLNVTMWSQLTKQHAISWKP